MEMELTKWQYGFTLMIFGMGLTMVTLYLLCWVARILPMIFKAEEED
ncbi:MAG: OadG-related small transporter subunit [Eubacteriales bacterium]|jgi:Na+-transporting methylmalonyl-CoA/oxaloacetate decarboxylase gamma subunit